MAAVIWGFIYIWFGELHAGMIPLVYVLLSLLSLLVLKISNVFYIYRFSQMVLILLLPFIVMLALGGFIKGSVVILWSLLAPLGALLSGQKREARYWFFGFLLLVFISVLMQPYLSEDNLLPPGIISLFFALNIGAVSFITFLVLNYFVRQKNEVIRLAHKNQELEVNRLEQEVMLRKSEKLATLGRLSAGIAHELNNPSAASLRGSALLRQTLRELEKSLLKLGGMNLSEKQLGIFESLRTKALNISHDTPVQSGLALSDLEEKTEAWLVQHNIGEAWKYTPFLAKLNLDPGALSQLEKIYNTEILQLTLAVLFEIHQTNELLEEIGQGTGRIAEIVKSLKAYSYQEEAPLQPLDVHEGLNNTLVMLRSQLKKGIEVIRDYDPELPPVPGYSNELNQVWTNLIDNAINAMNGTGKLTIRTARDGDWAIIRICDTGKGIPDAVQAKIFEPFFTTKQPGEGTGLGLNISRNIITERHHGRIRVSSVPGETCFEIRIPLSEDPAKKFVASKNEEPEK